jgi:hypothetical protein
MIYLEMTLEEQRSNRGQPKKTVVRKTISVRLPPYLIDIIPGNRTEFIEQAIVEKLTK